MGGIYPAQAAADKEPPSSEHSPTIIYGPAEPPYTEENTPYRKNTETEKLGSEYIKLNQDIQTTYDTGKLPEAYSSLKDLSDAVLNLPYIDIRERSQLFLPDPHHLNLAYEVKNNLARLLMKKAVEGLLSNQSLLDTLIILNKQANERLTWAKSVIADPNIRMTFGTVDWTGRDLQTAEHSLKYLQAYLVDVLGYTRSQQEVDLDKALSDAGYNAQDSKKIIELIKAQKTLSSLPSSPLKRRTSDKVSELDKKYEELKNWAKYHQMQRVAMLVKEFLQLPDTCTDAHSIDYDILHQKYRVMEFITAIPMTPLETPYRNKRGDSEIEAKYYVGGIYGLRRFSNEGDASELGMDEKEFCHYIIQSQISLLKQLRDRLKLAKTLQPKYDQKLAILQKDQKALNEENKVIASKDLPLYYSIYKPKQYGLDQQYRENKFIKYNIDSQIDEINFGIKYLQNTLYGNLQYVYPQKEDQLKLLLESGASQQEAKELLK